MRVLVILIIFVAVSITAFADDHTCNEAMSQKAETDVSRLEGRFKHVGGLKAPWEELHQSYRQFRTCDDGAIAEGYGGLVIKTLAISWKKLPELEKIKASDRGFYTFVLRHIDAVALPEELRTISDNAEKHCPVGLQTTCQEIRDRVKVATREDEASQTKDHK